MNIISIIKEGVVKGVLQLYDHKIDQSEIVMNVTRKEFEGDYTVVVFPFTKAARKKPEAIGEELGNFLIENIEQLKGFNIIKGFLNLEVADNYWTNFLEEVFVEEDYGQKPSNGKKVMVEFSSPNTNKPLHLGHIRNILLGWSCSKILEKSGYEVIKVQIVNDRGIAICKSMLAWQKFGNGETPESSGIKGDHFVGNFYVLFEQKFQEEYKLWQESPTGKEVFNKNKEKEQSESAFFKAYKNTYFNEFSQLGKRS